MSNGQDLTVCVVGLGKLGAPYAAVLASKKHVVYCVDRNPHSLSTIAAGKAPVDEAGLQSLIDICHERLVPTDDYDRALARASISFVVVPTPSLVDGSFSLEAVLDAVAGIGTSLRRLHRTGHIVVITSTVSPGSCDGPIRQTLEKASGMTLGHGVGLCYSPEFIALGSVIADITNPDFILVGASDIHTGQRLATVLRRLTDNQPEVMHTNLVNAEVAKLAVNTFVTTKISYANMLAELCENLPGADAVAVTRAVGLDSRIGSKYLRPGTPYGGPCFPRDNAALAAASGAVGASAELAQATDAINRRQVVRLAKLACSKVALGGQAAVLGLAYKPGTAVVDESAGLKIAAEVASRNIRTIVHDPVALANARTQLGDSVEYAETIEQCVENADVVVIATAWPEYSETGRVVVARRRGAGATTILDCWGVVPVVNTEANLSIWRPGLSLEPSRNSRQ